ncbi:Crp/Fnr family transcriptional regulator [Streptococcus suis]|uniref:Crp/Fnr family transcriptional regulator n=1 Tax=Streptococcus suis TaxID=1307 RepID=UPI000F62C951|nr:Crp/Fnr family transcriptional regulator [Streptococcus suis]RRR58283.1 Crp/Fnr family transcriptional regulator [Streptococcus suis]RRR65216.1 Crp/Fnr family transcriptional regulator [Streptococcus suis]HEM3555596.1 Crp/Fnr family transcriptional regulator [Streptococcus suis]HEM3557198.1 Crp/Fnr family transcriptional regulator [Streptococcus suis]HEM5961560.1 Crp/Fnr family transcriptional regulator [Streptococcus suis]
MISNEQYDYLRAHPTFERLTRDSFDQLAKHIRFRKIPKGQIFFYAEDPRDYLFVLYKGYARIEQYDETDSFTYLDYIRQGGAFPFGDMFQDKPYHYTAIAITDLEYFIVPMVLFETLSKINPSQMAYICQKLSKVLRFQELRLRNAMRSKASDRVVQALALLYWDMCQREQLATLPFEIHIQEISRLAATTRETVSHVLKQLKQDGKIAYSHKQLTYLDIDYFLENLTETH